MTHEDQASTRNTNKTLNEIAYAISSLVLGALLGAVIENRLSSGFKPIDIALIALLLALAAILVFLYTYFRRDQITIDFMEKHLKRMESRIGLHVSYQDISVVSGTKQDLLVDIVNNAQTEILVLEVEDQYLFPKKGHVTSEAATAYFRVLLDRVDEQTSKGVPFVYKRMVQFREPETKFSDLRGDAYLDHCREIARRAPLVNNRVYLKRTRYTNPVAFKLIDREYLVLHIAGVDQLTEQKANYLKGEIIIHDPRKELIQIFLREWDAIENSSYTRTISESEL